LEKRRLKKETEECAGEVFLGSDRDFHIMSHINHERSGQLFTEVFVSRITWTGVVIFVSKEI